MISTQMDSAALLSIDYQTMKPEDFFYGELIRSV
jgi:hypothetical protein